MSESKVTYESGLFLGIGRVGRGLGPPTYLSICINRKVLVKIFNFCHQAIFAGDQISNLD